MSQERVSGFPERGAELSRKSGELSGKSGSGFANFRVLEQAYEAVVQATNGQQHYSANSKGWAQGFSGLECKLPGSTGQNGLSQENFLATVSVNDAFSAPLVLSEWDYHGPRNYYANNSQGNDSCNCDCNLAAQIHLLATVDVIAIDEFLPWVGRGTCKIDFSREFVV